MHVLTAVAEINREIDPAALFVMPCCAVPFAYVECVVHAHTRNDMGGE
jgi:hypothetical protein